MWTTWTFVSSITHLATLVFGNLTSLSFPFANLSIGIVPVFSMGIKPVRELTDMRESRAQHALAAIVTVLDPVRRRDGAACSRIGGNY